MSLRLYSIGFLALAGCAGAPSEPPKGAAPTDSVERSAGSSRSVAILVPNMT